MKFNKWNKYRLEIDKFIFKAEDTKWNTYQDSLVLINNSKLYHKIYDHYTQCFSAKENFHLHTAQELIVKSSDLITELKVLKKKLEKRC